MPTRNPNPGATNLNEASSRESLADNNMTESDKPNPVVDNNGHDNRTGTDRKAPEELSRAGRYDGIVDTSIPSHAYNEQTQITFRTPDGKEHGPMPLGDWEAYSREHKI